MVSYETTGNVKEVQKTEIREIRPEKLRELNYASIIIPQCLFSCDIYARSYIKGKQGERKYSEIKHIKYNGGSDFSFDSNDFLLFSDSETTIASTNDGIEINALPLGMLAGLFGALELYHLATCGDICPILPVGVLDDVIKKGGPIIKETKKRVLELSSKEKVEKIVIRLGKTKDELLSAMRTPGGNPFRWSLNKRNTTRNVGSNYVEYYSVMKETTQTYANSKFYTNGIWEITDIFKGRLADKNFYASNLLYDQLIYAGKNIDDIKIITLDHVINKDTVEKLLKNSGSFNDTSLGKMIGYLSDNMGKEVKKIELGDYKYLDDLREPTYGYEFIKIIY